MITSNAPGSPPPMRGKVISNSSPENSFGITPAYAGKSVYFRCQWYYNGDHPRLCGEKLFVGAFRFSLYGSPPPMRGKVSFFVDTVIPKRITPAYAGKRGSGHRQAHQTQDHPRLCGEKTKKIPKQRYFFHQPASFSFSLQYT